MKLSEFFDKKTVAIILLAVITVGFILMSPGEVRPPGAQSIVTFEPLVAGEVSTGILTPEKTVVAFQSIVNFMPSFAGNTLTFEEGYSPGTIIKFLGIPLWIWLFIVFGGIVNLLVSVYPKLPVQIVRELPKDDPPIVKVANVFYAFAIIGMIVFFTYLGTSTGNYKFAFYYGIIYSSLLGSMVYITNKIKNFRISLAFDNTFLGIVPVSEFAYFISICLGTSALVLTMSMTATYIAAPYQAGLTLTESQILTASVSLGEDTLWFRIFGLAIMYTQLIVGCWIFGLILEGKPLGIIDLARTHIRTLLTLAVLCMVLTALIEGEVIWVQHHKVTYAYQAQLVAARLGITPEEAEDIMLKDIARFGFYGSMTTTILNTQLPANLYHLQNNIRATQ